MRPDEYRLSFVKSNGSKFGARVKAHEYLDGSIHIFYQSKKLRHKPIPKERTKSYPPLADFWTKGK